MQHRPILAAQSRPFGLFLNTVPSSDDVRLTNQQYLINWWHRFGLIDKLDNILNDKLCAHTCPHFSQSRGADARSPAFFSGAHSLSCSASGTLKRHNAPLKGSLATNLKLQNYYAIDTTHTLLDSFGKYAADAVISNPYADSLK